MSQAAVMRPDLDLAEFSALLEGERERLLRVERELAENSRQAKESLESFARSLLSPGEHKLTSSGRENLKNMAVIESAYLSARTGFPEEPGRILQMAPPEVGEKATV